MAVEEREEGPRSEWGERIGQWKKMDQKIITTLSDKPLAHEMQLAPEERRQSIWERQLKNFSSVLNYLFKRNEIEIDEYFPGVKVLGKTCEFLERDVRKALLAKPVEKVGMSGEEAMNIVSTILKREAVWESHGRRLYAEGKRAEKEGEDKLYALQLQAVGIGVRMGKGQEIFEGLFKELFPSE